MIIASVTFSTPLPKQIASHVPLPFGYKSASDFRLALKPMLEPITTEQQTYFVDDTGGWTGPREEVTMFLTYLCRAGKVRWRRAGEYYPASVPQDAAYNLAAVTGGTYENLAPSPVDEDGPDGLQPIY